MDKMLNHVCPKAKIISKYQGKLISKNAR
jgi:hypothetical protein